MSQVAAQKVIGNEANSVELLASRFAQPDDQELIAASQLLSLRLQQTLELDAMLELFCEQAADIVPCDSVAYQNASLKLFHLVGDAAEHRCDYQLELAGNTLGTIECTRQQPFTENELYRLEHLLTILVYPLRNALQYHQALQLAHVDPLTQIANRGAFDLAIQTEIARATRHDDKFALLVVDIDHFKHINDEYGHLTGDEVLKTVAQTLQMSLRAEDAVFRYGGEEFVVILDGANASDAEQVAERLRKALAAQPMRVLEQWVEVTASIGGTEWQVGELKNTLFHRADQALYAAKAAGRNRVELA